MIDVVITHALFPEQMLDSFSRANSRSVRSTHSVPHPTNAFALDDILIAALGKELDSMPLEGKTS
jgi:ribose-phosphate pyrophosphokinase